MGSYLLLPGYIFVETSRALVVYALLNSGVRPEATLINFLCVASITHFYALKLTLTFKMQG